MSVPALIVAACSAYTEHLEAGGEPEQIIAALRRDGGVDAECLSYLEAEVMGIPLTAPPRQAHPAGLTDREVEVLRLVATGLNVKQASRQLVISEHTARHHLESIYSKAGVSSRAGLTLFAIETGLLK
jgi:DNA-binding NarL/FixJ family response regulator